MSQESASMPTPTERRGESESAAKARRVLRRKQDKKLDEGLEETFPASDPVSVTQTTHVGRGNNRRVGKIS
jgi:hypothetical protein